MILYTPLFLEDVFGNFNEDYQSNYQEIDMGNKKVVVELIAPYQGKVIRLISSNPQDFLIPEYQPGNIINLTSST